MAITLDFWTLKN